MYAYFDLTYLNYHEFSRMLSQSSSFFAHSERSSLHFPSISKFPQTVKDWTRHGRHALPVTVTLTQPRFPAALGDRTCAARTSVSHGFPSGPAAVSRSHPMDMDIN